MGIFNGMTRRKFMKAAAVGAGAMAGGGGLLLPDRARAALTPPGGKFNNIELTYFQDSNWLHAPLWLSDHFKREAGVGIASRELYDGGDTVAKVLPQLLSRNPRFDWVQFPSLFFGAFAETGQLEPLDAYFEEYADADAYHDWVMPAYGEF
ncbi:MAG: twin-arginine translocation signal domain-containing protein [Inquilinus sp.]|nr:twin-arginine translocation signal domain-containing protein [Inquilinus sp.]